MNFSGKTAVFGMLAALVVTTPPASIGTPPDTLIAFERGYGFQKFDIWTVEANDPSSAQNLTNTPNADENAPVWSPDGSRIAFRREGTVWVMNADGSSQTSLSSDAGVPQFWSPDSTKVFYAAGCVLHWVYSAGPSNQEIHEVSGSAGVCQSDLSPDGQTLAYKGAGWVDPIKLADFAPDGSAMTFNRVFVDTVAGAREYVEPEWSPDGQYIAFGLDTADYVANINIVPITHQAGDNSDIQPITFYTDAYAPHASWSPDSQWITTLVLTPAPRPNISNIYFVPSDGAFSPIHQLTFNGSNDYLNFNPDWQPFPTPTPVILGFYFHGSGATGNPPTLFLDYVAPTGTTAKYKDSTGVNFNGGNPWKQIGSWTAGPTLATGSLMSPTGLRTWLGLKNSDDQGTNFDVRVEAYNDTTIVGSGEIYCVTGITRNPSLAKEVTVPMTSFSPGAFDGGSDILSIRVLTRVGTNGSGSFCGGHSNAVGLRLYFDAAARATKADETFGQ